MKKVGQIYRTRLIDHIKENVDNNQNVFLMSYSQISGGDISDFRKKLKSAGADVSVSKNSLARRALEDMDYGDLAEKISMQTAFVWSNSDCVEVSKILVDYEKKFEKLKVQGGVVEGKVLKQDQIKKLSELPSREVLLAMLLAAIQSPLTRLAGALNAKTRDLLSILKQLSEKKGGK